MSVGTDLVSVIIPVYNAEKFIEATVHSVLAQSYQNVELILVDDGSNDETFSIISQIMASDDRVQCHQMPSNTGGPAGPRNRGLDLASGKYVAFLDDDDIWLPQKLEVQLAQMKKRGLNFSSTRAIKIPENFSGASTPPVIERDSGLNSLSYDTLLRKNIIVNSSVVCERSLIGAQRFSTFARHVAVEDYVLWLQLHESSAAISAILPNKLMYYRVREGSISRSKLSMARKIFGVLGEVKLNGRGLGVKRWVYFVHYIISGLASKTYE